MHREEAEQKPQMQQPTPKMIRHSWITVFLSLALGYSIGSVTFRWFTVGPQSAYHRMVGRESQRSPLLIHDGRLFFLQPDLSLTILDMETGNVLGRDTGLRETVLRSGYNETALVTSWIVSNNLAYGAFLPGGRVNRNRQPERGDGGIAFNLESGAVEPAFYSDWLSDPIVFSGNLFAVDRRRQQLVMLDSQSWRMRDLTHTRGDLVLAGDRLLVFTKRAWGGENCDLLECFDAATGDYLWWRRSSELVEWERLIYDGKDIHLFTVLRDERGHRRSTAEESLFAIDMIQTYNTDGDLLFSKKADPVDFEDSWPLSNSRMRFRGVDYSGSLPRTQTEPTRGSHGEASRNRDKVMVGIRENASREQYVAIAYNDGHSISWSGRIRGMDWIKTAKPPHKAELLANIAVAVDDSRVVLGTPNQTIECLDKATGRTKWMYRFPGVDWVRWNGSGFTRYVTVAIGSRGDAFFTDAYEQYEKSLRDEGWNNVLIAGDGEAPDFLTHIDPAPVPFFKHDFVPFVMWGIPLLGVILVFIPFCRTGEKRLTVARTVLPAVTLVCTVSYCLLGGYSLAGAIAMLGVALLASAVHEWTRRKLVRSRR